MSEEFIEFYKRNTKSCTVVLERLNEKLLSQYLQKYDPNTAEMVGPVDNVSNQSKHDEIHSNDFSPIHKYSKGNIRRKPNKFALKNKFKQRRRKFKPLRSSDESPNETSRRESIKIKADILEDAENVKYPAFLMGDESRIAINKAENLEKTNKSLRAKGIGYWGNSKTNRNLFKEKESSKFELERSEITFKNILNSSFRETDSGKYRDQEIEVIQEITKPCVLQKKMNNVEETLLKNISNNADVNNEQYFEEDERDLREDNEDDRITIIFERTPPKKTDSEDVFEINEKGVECPINGFKCKEITNWKYEKLTNLKEKTLGQNSAAFRQSQNRTVESSTEKLAKNECVREHYLQKVCSLVKRLHELNRIILQLQKELLKNDDQVAVHFSKVIKVQKENFFKEIKKSQKPVTECYEKLLAFYGNSSNEVISKISQRAYLGADDVRNIVSRCFLLDEIYEIQRNNNASSEKRDKQNSFLHPKPSNSLHGKVNENFLKLFTRKNVSRDNHLVSQSHSFFPSESFKFQPQLIQEPANKHVIPWVLPARENAVSHPQRSSDEGLKSFWSSYDAYQENQDQVVDLRLKKPSQHDLRYPGVVSRPFDSLTHNMQSSSKKTLNFHSQNIKPTLSFSFPTNPPVSLSQQKKYKPESPTLGNPKSSFFLRHFYFPNCTQHKSASHQSPQNNIELLNFGPPAAQNISTCMTVRQRSDLQRDSFALPSKIHNRAVDSERQNLTFIGEARGPFEDYLNESVRSSHQKHLKQTQHELFVNGEEIFGMHCSIDLMSTREFKSTSSGVVQEVLDPTVPQKLTMKNCRLQAEPALRQENDEKALEAARKLSPLQSFKKKTKDCSGLNEENLKSRVYFCAQNGCKMPGLRVCKGCQSIIYCSETCQLKHWALKHKKECYQLRKLRGV